MKTKTDLANKIGTTLSNINFHLFALKEANKYYSFKIKKRNGTNREINAPVLSLKKIQTNIAELLCNEYEATAPKCVHGFRSSRSNLTNAANHLNQKVVIKIDLQDYFTNITGGMIYSTLISHPYRFSAPVARTITSLCTYKGYLPQGSPSSPIIANMVTRTLDIKLMSFAHKTRGVYSRYADDITFSYSHESKASACATFDDGSINISREIEEILNSKGFLINPEKTRYKKKSKRQITTGLIVNNKKLGLPREYIKETKLLIHIAQRYGIAAASDAFLSKHPINKYNHQNKFDIMAHIRGRLIYIRQVKGSLDDVYLGLALKYKTIDPAFTVDEKIKQDEDPKEIAIFCEGETDYKHISLALDHFKSKGLYLDLKLDLSDKELKGWDSLKKKFDNLKKVRLSHKHVAIFDSDVPDLLRSYPKETCKKLAENLFIIVIPTPHHINKEDPFCIEMLYHESDRKRKDGGGRRLFLSSEFLKDNGFHKELKLITRPTKGSTKLVIEEDVFSTEANPEDAKNLAISKNGFFDIIKDNSQNVDFSGFRALLDYLHYIHSGRIN